MKRARSSMVVDGNEGANLPFRRPAAWCDSYKAATFMDMRLEQDMTFRSDHLVRPGERTRVDGGNRPARRP
jgi:hypothetical protein